MVQLETTATRMGIVMTIVTREAMEYGIGRELYVLDNRQLYVGHKGVHHTFDVDAVYIVKQFDKDCLNS